MTNRLVPYGMYRVDGKYIAYMREHQPKIISAEVTDIYCGPVVLVDDVWGFYAPVTARPDNSSEIFLSEDYAVSGFVHVCKMIPCCYKVLEPVLDETPESAFCLDKENREFIELMAKALYEADKKEYNERRKPE